MVGSNPETTGRIPAQLKVVSKSNNLAVILSVFKTTINSRALAKDNKQINLCIRPLYDRVV